MSNSTRFWKKAGPHAPGLEDAVRTKCLLLGLIIAEMDDRGLRVYTSTPEEQAAADELDSWLRRRGQIVTERNRGNGDG